MKSTAHFQIAYDGPSLAQNEMDVRELLPALIALNTRFTALPASSVRKRRR